MDWIIVTMEPPDSCSASGDASDPGHDDDFGLSDVSSNALFDARQADAGFANLMGTSDLTQPNQDFTATPGFLLESSPPSLVHSLPSLDSDFCDPGCEWNLGGPQLFSFLDGTASSDALTNTLFHQESDTNLMDYMQIFGISPSLNNLPWCSLDDPSMVGLGAQFAGSNSFCDLPLASSGHYFGTSYPSSVVESPGWNGPAFSSTSGPDDPQDLVERTYRCNWPKCSSIGIFGSVEEQKNHTKMHAEQVKRDWRIGERCTWFQCSSRASHTNKKLFEAHVNNIHVNPLVCTVENCRHKDPFRAKHDLQRHISTAHQLDAKFNCPFPFCSNRGSRFMRKDKWLSHLKKHHETEPCPYFHCYHGQDNNSSSRWSASKHIGKGHSFYECGLYSCQDKISRFSEVHLLEHVQVHHGLEWEAVLKAKDLMMVYGSFTMRPEYICQDKVTDCKLCKK